MLKRINVTLNDKDLEKAKEILRTESMTLSAWIRLQIKRLIKQKRKDASK